MEKPRANPQLVLHVLHQRKPACDRLITFVQTGMFLLPDRSDLGLRASEAKQNIAKPNAPFKMLTQCMIIGFVTKIIY